MVDPEKEYTVYVFEGYLRAKFYVTADTEQEAEEYLLSGDYDDYDLMEKIPEEVDLIETQ